MSIEDKIIVKGKPLENMPVELYVIAALVKRLGGEVILSDNEMQPSKFTGVMMYMSDKNNMVIKAA